MSTQDFLARVISMVTFTIYIIIWDCGMIGGCAYLVFWKDASGWWFLLAAIMCGSSFKPAAWRKLWEDDK